MEDDQGKKCIFSPCTEAFQVHYAYETHCEQVPGNVDLPWCQTENMGSWQNMNKRKNIFDASGGSSVKAAEALDPLHVSNVVALNEETKIINPKTWGIVVDSTSVLKPLDLVISYGWYLTTVIKTMLPGYISPLEFGKTRIEFTCKCGQKITDDYVELTPGGADRFRHTLNSSLSVRQGNLELLSKKGSATRINLINKIDQLILVAPTFNWVILLFGGLTFNWAFLCFGGFIFCLLPLITGRSAKSRTDAAFTEIQYELGFPGASSIGAGPKNRRTGAGKDSAQNLASSSSQTSAIDSENSVLSHFKRLQNTFSLKGKQTDDSERGLPLHSLPISIPTTEDEDGDHQSLRPSELLFLLLCYPSGRYATRLLQLDLHSLSAKCDQSLFALLRSNYQDMRGRFKSLFLLKRLRSIKFIRFEMYQSELVDVRKTDDIPPPDHKEYRYMPTPLDVIPPIGDGLMMHLLNNPTHASAFPHLLARLPKKLHEKVLFRPAHRIDPNWGLQYLESWDFAKIWILTFILFGGGSLLFDVLWTEYGHSVQDAFAVSAYVVAIVGGFGGTSQAILVMGEERG